MDWLSDFLTELLDASWFGPATARWGCLILGLGLSALIVFINWSTRPLLAVVAVGLIVLLYVLVYRSNIDD